MSVQRVCLSKFKSKAVRPCTDYLLHLQVAGFKFAGITLHLSIFALVSSTLPPPLCLLLARCLQPTLDPIVLERACVRAAFRLPPFLLSSYLAR